MSDTKQLEALRDAAKAEKDFQETKHTDAANALWLAACHTISACDRAIASLRAAEPVAETPAVRERRRVYKGTHESSALLKARFSPPSGRAFEYDGHRWVYMFTDFDDRGEFDVIQRGADSAEPVAEEPKACANYRCGGWLNSVGERVTVAHPDIPCNSSTATECDCAICGQPYSAHQQPAGSTPGHNDGGNDNGRDRRDVSDARGGQAGDDGAEGRLPIPRGATDGEAGRGGVARGEAQPCGGTDAAGNGVDVRGQGGASGVGNAAAGCSTAQQPAEDLRWLIEDDGAPATTYVCISPLGYGLATTTDVNAALQFRTEAAAQSVVDDPTYVGPSREKWAVRGHIWDTPPTEVASRGRDYTQAQQPAPADDQKPGDILAQRMEEAAQARLAAEVPPMPMGHRWAEDGMYEFAEGNWCSAVDVRELHAAAVRIAERRERLEMERLTLVHGGRLFEMKQRAEAAEDDAKFQAQQADEARRELEAARLDLAASIQASVQIRMEHDEAVARADKAEAELAALKGQGPVTRLVDITFEVYGNCNSEKRIYSERLEDPNSFPVYATPVDSISPEQHEAALAQARRGMRERAEKIADDLRIDAERRSDEAKKRGHVEAGKLYAGDALGYVKVRDAIRALPDAGGEGNGNG